MSIYPNGRELSYTFDDLDRYLQVGDVTNPALSPVATYGYIGYRVLTRTSKNGTKLSYLNPSSGLDDGYDGLRRVVIQRHVDASNAVVAQFSHIYNRTNNRLNEIREHHLDGGLRVGEQYTFDSLYRLANFQVGTFTAGGVFNAPSASQQWQLDGVGNWSIFTDNGTPKTQTINSVNEYTAFGGVANAFDANKNLTDDGTFLYAFDFLNRLREVRRKSDNALIASYIYDSNGSPHLMGAGRRVKKITTADANVGAGVVYFLYDGIMTVEERDGMDAVLRQYVNGQRIDEHLSMETYTSGSIASTHYYHENALGNVTALTDSASAVVERYTYQAYGAPEFRDSLSAPLSLFSSPAGNPFLFNGQRYDPESGLSYYRHRYLNHAQGRFVSNDPWGYDVVFALYVYVLNNPLASTDYLGLQEKKAQAIGVPEYIIYDPSKKEGLPSEMLEGGYKGWADWKIGKSEPWIIETRCTEGKTTYFDWDLMMQHTSCWCKCYTEITCRPPALLSFKIYLPVNAERRLVEHEYGHYTLVKNLLAENLTVYWDVVFGPEPSPDQPCSENIKRLKKRPTKQEAEDFCTERWTFYLQTRSRAYDLRTWHGRTWFGDPSEGLGKDAPELDLSKPTIKSKQ